jgi:hypothetical protein
MIASKVNFLFLNKNREGQVPSAGGRQPDFVHGLYPDLQKADHRWKRHERISISLTKNSSGSMTTKPRRLSDNLARATGSRQVIQTEFSQSKSCRTPLMSL